MKIAITGTTDPRLGTFDEEGARVHPAQDIYGHELNGELQRYNHRYFNHNDQQYFVAIPIANAPEVVDIEWPVEAPVVEVPVVEAEAEAPQPPPVEAEGEETSFRRARRSSSAE